MGWPKNKSRGSRCKVCKHYFKPHGLGPHMAVHRKPKATGAEDTPFEDALRQSVLKAAELRNEADRIEEAVEQVRGLMKLLK